MATSIIILPGRIAATISSDTTTGALPYSLLNAPTATSTLVGKIIRIEDSTALGNTVRGLEVMVYRESYGGQVRDAKWRSQFVGKANGAALTVDQDITNIGGATMSCVHISDGVKRVLALYALAVKAKA